MYYEQGVRLFSNPGKTSAQQLAELGLTFQDRFLKVGDLASCIQGGEPTLVGV
jgi:hypothetical protein